MNGVGLRVIGGPLRGQFFHLPEGRTLIGRDATNGIVLDSSMVSRQHAELRVGTDQVMIRNLSQANGTVVNHRKIDETALQTGDQIYIGDFILEFVRNADVSQHGQRRETVVGLVSPGADKPVAKLPMPKIPLLLRLPWKSQLLWILFVTLIVDHLLITQLFSQRVIRDVTQESLGRARELTRYLAEKNKQDLDQGNENLLDVEVVSEQDGVLGAIIANASGKIVAPAHQLNQPLEDETSRAALKLQSNEVIVSPKLAGNLYRVAAPIRAFRNSQGNYQTIGVAVVVFSPKNLTTTREAVKRLGATALVLALLTALFIFFMVRLVTLTPIRNLVEMTRILLRGEVPRMERENPLPELTELIDALNAYAARQGTPGSAAPFNSTQPIETKSISDDPAMLKWLAAMVSDALMMMSEDGMILALNQKAKALLEIETTVKTGRDLSQVVTNQYYRNFLNGCMSELIASGSQTMTKTLDYGDFAYQFTLHRYLNHGGSGGGTGIIAVVIEKL